MTDATPRRPDPTVPEADALEQGREWDETEASDDVRLTPDVPEGDALDQARPVPLDDEER